MQRLIPYGRDYAESGEFTIDEGSTVVLWLVRQDKTTTVGEAEAEVQIKGSDGNFTTVDVMNDKKPSATLSGSDDQITYKVVRKTGSPIVAVDGTSSGPLSQQLKSSVLQPLVNGNCMLTRFTAALDPNVGAGGIGTGFRINGLDPANNFGVVAQPLPQVPHIEIGSIPGFARATLGLPVGSPLSLAPYFGGKIAVYGASGTKIGEGTIPANVTLNGAATENSFSVNFFTVQFVAGQSYYMSVCPIGKSVTLAPIADTGRFKLDQNDFPARLSASNFANGTEAVKLFAVEGNVLIPVRYKNGTDADLTQAYPAYAIDAPGWYEWQRTPGSDISVYLNTGWG